VHSSTSTSEAIRHLALIAGTLLLATICSVGAGSIRFNEAVSDQSRVFNVRLVPEGYRAPLMNAFISKSSIAQSERLIVVLGDSQSWGFRLREERVYTTLLKERLPDYRVVNLSIVDGRVNDQMMILDMLEANGIRPQLIITSANIATVKTPDFGRLEPSSRPYWSYFLSPLNVYRLGQLARPNDPEPVDFAYKRFQVPDRFRDTAEGLSDLSRRVSQVL
jgi:hypothetical protein